MISVEEARARILTDLRPTPAEIVALADAWNRVTANAVVARLTQPPADVSAMDGYALRSADGALDFHASADRRRPGGPPLRRHRRPRPDRPTVHRKHCPAGCRRHPAAGRRYP